MTSTVRRLFFSLALSFSVLLAAAQSQSAPMRTLIRAGHVIDVHTGNEAADQTIVVTGDSISAIAPTASIPKQNGDTEIDLRGMTVLPGLIDVHTHLRSEEHTSELQSREK